MKEFAVTSLSSKGQVVIPCSIRKELGILVTSRYSEDNVREVCETNNIKLLPKGLAFYIAIIIASKKLSNKKLCNIFLDDDYIIRLGWEMVAKNNNTPLDTFSSSNDLFAVIDTYDKESTFYIDSNLGNDEKGEIVSKKIYDLGFKNLYLATGYSIEHFTNIEHIKDVVGKEAPWG